MTIASRYLEQTEESQSLPAGWRWVPLADVCQQDRQVLDPQSVEARRRTYLSLEHIESITGRILRQPSEPVQDEGKSTSFGFDARHILYGKLRPYLNKVALPEFEGRCTTELIPLLPTNADRHYIAWLLRRPETVAAAMRGKTGSRMPRADMDDLLRLKIPLPPLAEQRRIAAILQDQLAAVERARAAAEEQLRAAQDLPAAYLRSAFQGITPLCGGLRHDREPSGWKWHGLRKVARLESGHTPSRRHPEWWGGDIPWISLADIRNLDGKVAYETIEYTNPDGIDNSAARVLPAGTVVMSRTASVGYVTIMGRDMATSQDFVNWVCGPELMPEFLALLLQASRQYIKTLSSGAIHQTVYMPTVEAFEVCLPSLPTQQALVDEATCQIAAAEQARLALQAQLDAINRLPASLLRRAFNGEL
jgi:type I restriction enzyme S subunit